MNWWMQTESAQVSTRSEWDLLPGVRLPLDYKVLYEIKKRSHPKFVFLFVCVFVCLFHFIGGGGEGVNTFLVLFVALCCCLLHL